MHRAPVWVWCAENPEIKYKEYSMEMERLPKKQLAILSASSSYVKPGGTLLYSTCTINPEENEEVVEAFLRKILRLKRKKSFCSFHRWMEQMDSSSA